MPKSAQVSDDKLVMAVRDMLKEIEPRKLPTERTRNEWGFECWVCPYCGELCHIKGRYNHPNYGGYNMHFAGVHSTPFWKENQLIKLIKGAK